MGNKRTGKRRKGIRWDYNLDGMSYYERIKGYWKRYWRRWKRRIGKVQNSRLEEIE